MAMRISNLLTPNQVILDIHAKTKTEAIQEVAEPLHCHKAMRRFPEFCDALIERDEMTSTSMGNGVAFPHARCDEVSEILFSAGRSVEGIPFGEERAHLIFVIGIPRSKISEYLVIVGTLARLLKNPVTRENLLRAETPEEFISYLGAD